MEKLRTCSIVVHLFVMLTVSSVFAVSEKSYFEIKHSADTSSKNCSEHVAKVSTAISLMKCCADCSRNEQCQGVMYDPVTLECEEVQNATFEDQTCTADIGAAYYSSKVCGRYLVSGTPGVKDDQLSESSVWCDLSPLASVCQPAEMRILSAKYARLNSTGLYTGGWLSAGINQHQYVQVNFRKATTVTQVVMQARDPAWNPYDQAPVNQYVTRFKFLYSQDCTAYDELKGESGGTLIFDGNSSSDETVVRDLPRKVRARCFRINPVSWVHSIAMRFDLIGCL